MTRPFDRDPETGLLLPRRARGAHRLETRAHPQMFGGMGNPVWQGYLAPPGALDNYTTDMWGAYSLNKMVSLFSGSPIRVRRSNDNAEQDIGLSGSSLDTAALASFVGANDGFVVTWYDQSGAHHDLSQGTQAKQPKIVDAGTYLSELIFDGVDDFLGTSASSNAVPGLTFHIAGRNRVSAKNYETLVSNGGIGSTTIYDKPINTARHYSLSVGHESGYELIDSPFADDSTTYVSQVDRTQVALVDEISQYVNGVAPSPLYSSGSTVTGNSTPGVWYLGASGGTSQFSKLAVSAFIIYEVAQSPATIASIAPLLARVSEQGRLDSFTSSVWGIYSIRKLRSAYSGSCMRIRRSNDDAEQDIGFTLDSFDSAAVASFVGANSAYVTKIYDQSGSSNDLVQATAGSQPRIVNAGVVDTRIVFDGSNDAMETTNNSGTPTAFTAYMRGATRTAAQVRLLIHNPADANNTANLYYEPGGSPTLTTRSYINQGANLKNASYDYKLAGQVIANRWDRTQSGSGAAATSAAFSGGSALTGVSIDNTGSITGSFPAKPWRVAGDVSSMFCALDLHSIVIYETAHSNATVERVSLAIG